MKGSKMHRLGLSGLLLAAMIWGVRADESCNITYFDTSANVAGTINRCSSGNDIEAWKKYFLKNAREVPPRAVPTKLYMLLGGKLYEIDDAKVASAQKRPLRECLADSNCVFGSK
jgi:hypothetical protein